MVGGIDGVLLLQISCELLETTVLCSFSLRPPFGRAYPVALKCLFNGIELK